MMEFEDQAAEDHEEEEEEDEEEAVEPEDDDTELFPPTHPSSYDNDSVPRVTNSVISPTPLALKMSNNPDTPPPLQPIRNHLNRSQLSSARYKECLKNHAVGIGGHALDGCGEFMPAGPDGSLDALKCAACNCHRNFHRKEFTDSTPEKITTNLYPHPHLHPPPHIHHHPPPQVFQFYPYNRTPGPGSGFLQLPAPPQRPGPPPLQQTQPLALPCTTTTSSGDGEDITGMVSPGSSGGMMMMTSSSKKRFRTKFTAEQKERMLELAERMGWRLQKQDEPMIQRFCEENGVKRQVLKVWMHNNKNTLGSINGGGSGGGDGDSSGGMKP